MLAILIQGENREIYLDLTLRLFGFGFKHQTGTTTQMKIRSVSVLYCCNNDVSSVVSELCQSRRK